MLRNCTLAVYKARNGRYSPKSFPLFSNWLHEHHKTSWPKRTRFSWDCSKQEVKWLHSFCMARRTRNRRSIFRKLLFQRCCCAKPLQYIFGDVQFLSRTFFVRPPVLIPRWETEEWTTSLIELSGKMQQQSIWPTCLQMADLCSGSGVIALSFAAQFPLSSILGVDFCSSAIKLAIQNQRMLGIENAAFILSDVIRFIETRKPHSSVADSFHLITCNPPYIPSKKFMKLDRGVRRWESKNSLISGLDGTELLGKIIESSYSLLKQNGILAVEIDGGHQIDCAKHFAREYQSVEFIKDSAGITRLGILRK
jgi:release factor glutamine methyltransferase